KKQNKSELLEKLSRKKDKSYTLHFREGYINFDHNIPHNENIEDRQIKDISVKSTEFFHDLTGTKSPYDKDMKTLAERGLKLIKEQEREDKYKDLKSMDKKSKHHNDYHQHSSDYHPQQQQQSQYSPQLYEQQQQHHNIGNQYYNQNPHQTHEYYEIPQNFAPHFEALTQARDSVIKNNHHIPQVQHQHQQYNQQTSLPPSNYDVDIQHNHNTFQGSPPDHSSIIEHYNENVHNFNPTTNPNNQIHIQKFPGSPPESYNHEQYYNSNENQHNKSSKKHKNHHHHHNHHKTNQQHPDTATLLNHKIFHDNEENLSISSPDDNNSSNQHSYHNSHHSISNGGKKSKKNKKNKRHHKNNHQSRGVATQPLANTKEQYHMSDHPHKGHSYQVIEYPQEKSEKNKDKTDLKSNGKNFTKSNSGVPLPSPEYKFLINYKDASDRNDKNINDKEKIGLDEPENKEIRYYQDIYIAKKEPKFMEMGHKIEKPGYLEERFEENDRKNNQFRGSVKWINHKGEQGLQLWDLGHFG
ncbi:GATA zinc finger domain-containing protein 14-like, partial [Condylostylus longicornis]|uniref:GATA zinc finger domain-containing protein 14-like n=1 Tax=Condylostylus longicornis TaxID=2530218 RepID=UPI00244E225D